MFLDVDKITSDLITKAADYKQTQEDLKKETTSFKVSAVNTDINIESLKSTLTK